MQELTGYSIIVYSVSWRYLCHERTAAAKTFHSIHLKYQQNGNDKLNISNRPFHFCITRLTVYRVGQKN